MLIKKGERGGLADWECDECGVIFHPMSRRANEAVKLNNNMFCSPECRKENWKINAVKRLKLWSNKGNLKSGISVSTDGYVQIRVVGKPRNLIKLHRYLMEVKIGRPLMATEIVHHKDEDKLNNCIDNLQIVSRSEHNKIHKFLCK